MQFDVYPTPGKAKEFFPFVVDVQADLLAALDSRMVAPLLPVQSAKATPKLLTRLNPVVRFGGQQYAVLTNQMSNVSASRLRESVGSLADQRLTIVDAIDFLINDGI